MDEWVDVNANITCLQSDDPFVVDERDFDDLLLQLTGLRFAFSVIDGTEITSERQFIDQVGIQLGFPSYYGRNWDAFTDCFGDLVHASGARLAIVWRHADRAWTANWHQAFRITNYLTSEARDHSVFKPGDQRQVIVLLTGTDEFLDQSRQGRQRTDPRD